MYKSSDPFLVIFCLENEAILVKIQSIFWLIKYVFQIVYVEPFYVYFNFHRYFLLHCKVKITTLM